MEIQYTEEEFSEDKYFFDGYFYNPQKGKLNVDNIKISKAPKDILRIEFINNKRREIMILLSVFTDKYVFHYPQIQGWFIELQNDNIEKLENKYGQLLYLHSFTEEDKSPDTLNSINNEEFFINPTILTIRNADSGMLLGTVSISDMFRYYYNSPIQVKEAVRNAARLYYQSQNHFDVDLATEFVYLVIALESLIQVEYSMLKVTHCDKCKQPTFAVSKKFPHY